MPPTARRGGHGNARIPHRFLVVTFSWSWIMWAPLALADSGVFALTDSGVFALEEDLRSQTFFTAFTALGARTVDGRNDDDDPMLELFGGSRRSATR